MAKQPAQAGERRPLTTYTYISYGAPAAPLSLAGLPLAVYLPVIYADSDGFGLSLAAVGAILALSRVSDVITDPLIGRYSDKWRTRWGRRKPWVLVGTPIFGLGMWYLFHPPFEFSDVTVLGNTFSNGYIWLFVTLTVFYLGATIKDVPFSAWGAELSSNYNERTLIMSWKEVFNVAGGLLSAFTPAIILFFGYDKPTEAVFALVVMMCISMPLINLNCLAVVPEWRVVEREELRIRIIDGLRVAAGNKPFMLLVVVFAVGSIGSANDEQSLVLLRQARAGGRRTLRPLSRALLPVPDRRHPAVVQALPAHRQAQGDHVGGRVVCAVVVVHSSDRHNAWRVVLGVRDHQHDRLPAGEHASRGGRLLRGHRDRQVPVLHRHHVLEGFRHRRSFRAALRHVRRRGGRGHGGNRQTPRRRVHGDLVDDAQGRLRARHLHRPGAWWSSGASMPWRTRATPPTPPSRC